MINTIIRNMLLDNANIKSYVNNRVYYLYLPQDVVLPAISFFMVSNFRHHDIDVTRPRFQFDCWATSLSTAKSLADEIRKTFQREKGVYYGTSIIQGIYITEQEFYETDTKIYHVTIDMYMIYKD